MASELVRVGVDIIVTSTNPSTIAAMKATTTVPIVMTIGVEPVATRLVQSLTKPDGNVTGAGTGVLSLAAAALGAEVLATDFSPGMVDYLKGQAQGQGIRGIEAVVMDGQALDMADNRFDAVFSIFALMFFSDRAAGFRELHRVTRPKGLSVVTSWSSMERLRFAQAILGTLREAVPDLPTPTKPPPWLSLADRGAFKAEMHAGGFPQVNMFSVTHLWTFASPEALFEALPSLSPAFNGILGSLQSDQREAFRTAFVRRIRADQGDGPFGLEGEAHIAVGIK